MWRRSLRRPGAGGLPSFSHFSRACPPFQARVVKPRISTETPQRSSVRARMSAQVAATVIGNAPLWLLYVSLAIAGLGVGTISTTGVNILQERTPAEEMGRVSAAHQFVRTLMITYSVGIVSALILTTVDRRAGDVEAVRELLGGDADTVDPAIADALGAGFGYAMIAACIAATLCVPSALRLVRTRHNAVTSAA